MPILMPSVMIRGGKILLNGGKIAVDDDCCCQDCNCANTLIPHYITNGLPLRIAGLFNYDDTNLHGTKVTNCTPAAINGDYSLVYAGSNVWRIILGVNCSSGVHVRHSLQVDGAGGLLNENDDYVWGLEVGGACVPFGFTGYPLNASWSLTVLGWGRVRTNTNPTFQCVGGGQFTTTNLTTIGCDNGASNGKIYGGTCHVQTGDEDTGLEPLDEGTWSILYP